MLRIGRSALVLPGPYPVMLRSFQFCDPMLEDLTTLAVNFVFPLRKYFVLLFEKLHTYFQMFSNISFRALKMNWFVQLLQMLLCNFIRNHLTT